ncbi:LiaF domain-containing protein [Vallitalea maricola]|uniref:Uncharacterized protein n=1 Tax=Vallitalea maricola TaxID=3074433 RepID=A0ACB5UQU3_9FIRM|nr:hypothetical protein AN2V17_45650 [Vallitalea sp. AN17-2]
MKKKRLLVLGAAIGGGAYYAYKKIQKITDAFSKVVIFNNEDIKYEQDQEIEDAAVVFGSLNIDLTDIDIEDGTTIKVLALFSNLTIKVPQEWKIVAEGNNKAGNIEIDASKEDEESKDITLNIEYDIRFSNVNISNE